MHAEEGGEREGGKGVLREGADECVEEMGGGVRNKVKDRSGRGREEAERVGRYEL